mmetsp:Transcript_4167/g.11798  ORF Transcript_4167/g.11798 Transcript_4167/m.11798 type:complete len:452 (-) Transcript_4167:1021-2376(-)
MPLVLATLALTGLAHAAAGPSRGIPFSSTRASPRMAATSATAFDAAKFDEVVMKTYARNPIAMDRGEGCVLWDVDGNRYLDFAAGIATACLGHAHPALVEAVSKQMSQVTHVSNLYYIPPQGDLAAELVKRTPWASKAFFCNSGAEANEGAIKLARKHARVKHGIERPLIISALNSFHGRTLATIAATGQPKYQEPFLPMPDGFVHTPYNDIDALRKTLEAAEEGVGKRLAAILLEPLQGEGGITPGDRAFFQAARDLCDERGALLMFDEVQVGVGRTGTFWAHEQLGVQPDVLSCAKALGGGVPIGAMLCSDEANVFIPGEHATTYGGNFLATAAGNAVLAEIDRANILDNVKARGAQLRAGLERVASDTADAVTQVRGWGLILGVVLSESLPATAAEVCGAAAARGLLLVPAGPKVVRFVPPLIVSEKEVDEAVATFEECVKAFAAKSA